MRPTTTASLPQLLAIGLLVMTSSISSADTLAAAGPGVLVSGQAWARKASPKPKPTTFATAQTATQADDPKSFFRTKRGRLLLIFTGAGIAYVSYSKVHDRVRSPARNSD